jgi:hypothetical protein
MDGFKFFCKTIRQRGGIFICIFYFNQIGPKTTDEMRAKKIKNHISDNRGWHLVLDVQ